MKAGVGIEKKRIAFRLTGAQHIFRLNFLVAATFSCAF